MGLKPTIYPAVALAVGEGKHCHRKSAQEINYAPPNNSAGSFVDKMNNGLPAHEYELPIHCKIMYKLQSMQLCPLAVLINHTSSSLSRVFS